MAPQEAGSISDISTSFMGLFYAGYLPSFWVRLRAIHKVVPTRFAALDRFAPLVPKWFPQIIPNPNLWTQGAAVTWWTYITIVASDVGAYFIGKVGLIMKKSMQAPYEDVDLWENKIVRI